MKNVIVKALTKADQLSLTKEQAADLVLEYMDIASDLGASPIPDRIPPPPPVVVETKPVNINRTIKKNPNLPAWKTDDLYKHLSKFDFSISLTPDGWEKEASFRCGLVKDPNGMKGVGLIFQAIESPDFKVNYFFSNESEDVDTDGAIEEVKKSINNMLRRADKPIPNSTVPLRAIPSDIASMAGFSASV